MVCRPQARGSTNADEKKVDKHRTMVNMKLARVIAHRGCKSLAPENTLASIRAAKRVGANFVEVDVLLSKDKVPIIHHDVSVDRSMPDHGFLQSTAEKRYLP
mmetsp:Transcript_51901/g.135416  ORF Transcript_51901/g.135416 Transcript_51901/m.135416 type:complete len:102 (+) Transcript_51901:1024-1329(+)